MNCVLFTKNTLARPFPAAPDPTANPGEFALIDNGGTLTLAIVDPAGNPSPIDPAAAVMTITSDAPNVVEVRDLQDFTWQESVAKCATPTTSPTVSAPIPAPATSKPSHTTSKTPHTASKPVHPPVVVHPSKTTPPAKPSPSAGAVATIAAVVTWTKPTACSHKLTWKDTLNTDPQGTLVIERSFVTVSQ